MTAKYAAGTCHYCHIKKIKPEMFQTHIEIKRGRSSGSWGIGRSQYGKKKRKATHLRYNAGRTYYSNKKIWCCRECYAENHPGEAGFKSKRQVRNENIKKEEERKEFIELSKKKAIKITKLVKKHTENYPQVFNKKNLSNINSSLNNLSQLLQNSSDYEKIDEAISNCKKIFLLNCPNFKTRILFRFWNRPIIYSYLIICIIVLIFVPK